MKSKIFSLSFLAFALLSSLSTSNTAFATEGGWTCSGYCGGYEGRRLESREVMASGPTVEDAFQELINDCDSISYSNILFVNVVTSCNGSHQVTRATVANACIYDPAQR